MKKTIFPSVTIFMLAVIISLIACNRNNTDVATPAKAVIMAGYSYNSSGVRIATVWANGEPMLLSSGYSGAMAVCIDKKDVYVAGWEASGNIGVAKCWKNGVLLPLSGNNNNCSANGIAVKNGNIYMSGIERNATGKLVARYWKNGIPVSLTDGTTNAEARSVFISGNDVYVAGYETNSNGIRVAKYWKNGVSNNITNGTYNALATTIFVKDGDVYTAGNEYAADGYFRATYWKNGVPFLLPEGLFGNVTSIYVDGNNVVHAVGTENVGGDTNPTTNTLLAKYWKNNVAHNLASTARVSGATSVTMESGDIYIGGYQYDDYSVGSRARMWKNTASDNYNLDGWVWGIAAGKINN